MFGQPRKGQSPNRWSRHLSTQYNLRGLWLPLGFPCGSNSKESACSVEDLGLIPGSGNPLEKGMATHSSILAWRIEEPGSMGSQRVRHNWTTNTFPWLLLRDWINKQTMRRLDITIDLSPTTGRNQSRKPNHNLCSDKPRAVRTWSLTASLPTCCPPFQLTANQRKPNMFPKPIT